MRRGAVIALSLALGAVSTLAQLPLALWTMGPLPRSGDYPLIRGGDVWRAVERRGTLVRWVNLESDERLLNPRPDDGTVPAWAEPGARADERLTRTAAVAVGWPAPAVVCRWTTARNDVNFPPPATNDDSGWAPKDAVRRLWEGDPAGTRTILPQGAAIDAAVAGGAWFASIECAALLRRRLRRNVTPPG